ncbi:acetamidase/formamidase family protein [Kineococcus rhizosphaerae]|uniref:Acetamidase/formamidase n=1 Tax=Kineococcus rhizosphaerae TaxID=559628 RepID=A0A2T0R8D3_9ACTN|nr:acetamidase/formamidase family protein [Kineococcus rhizosphaerae]PRY17431.1 acetamidase/formamidase [Kineococcus rhizosphaerae]
MHTLDDSVEVVEFTPTPEQYAWTFGGVAPVATVRPGTALKLWSDDAFCGRLRSVTDLPGASLQMPYVNPQTGPFFVEGAEPGDTLVLHVVDLEPARDWGASALIPFFGGLTSTDRTATLQDPLPERTWIYHLDSARGTIGVQLGETTLELPVEPMLGTVGVAPAAGEVRSSLVPDTFGGNMDTPELKPGTTVYLRVNVEGALFSLGDGHYRQGEGESCGTAVEGAMNSLVLVDLLKTPGPAWPRLESDTHWTVVGSSRPLEDAWRAGQVDAVGWIRELTGLDVLDAYQVLSQISEVPLANAVDVNYSVATKLPKRLLPTRRPAYDGIHDRLRALVR